MGTRELSRKNSRASLNSQTSLLKGKLALRTSKSCLETTALLVALWEQENNKQNPATALINPLNLNLESRSYKTAVYSPFPTV